MAKTVGDIKITTESALPGEQDQYFSRSVSKAFEILDLFSQSNEAFSLNQIAARTQLTKSFTYRLLRTLEVLNRIVRRPDGQFVISPDSSTPAFRLESTLLKIARPEMQRLNMQFGETVSLAALFGKRIEVIEVFDSPHLMRMTNIVGRILPPHASSLGKIITAFQSPEQQRLLLLSYGLLHITDRTITDEFALAKEYEQARKEGFAQDDEESILDAYCLGVPVSTAEQGVVAGISLSMPKSRMFQGQAEKDHILHALTESATAISFRLSEELHSRGLAVRVTRSR